METLDGEIIPRGKIGQRSKFTTPLGNIINFDNEGMPLQKGPKPEVIRLQVDGNNQPLVPHVRLYEDDVGNMIIKYESPSTLIEPPADIKNEEVVRP